ncbi:MAG: zinc transporter ZupT [Spirochaetales bacterium]|nr:zinc transporter ZupT [Spirochaetales bacterium]
MIPENFWFAISLTLLAGLSTGIGSILAFLSKSFNPKFLAGTLGFSAGVMIYVSMIEIFGKAKDSLSEVYGLKTGYVVTTVAFFIGIAVIAIIDALVPERENPHEIAHCEECPEGRNHAGLMRMGLFSALAIGIHNFPEGLATFMGALGDPALGISITVAIAIHNIPEGIAVSMPIYYATGSRKKAFFYSALSGFSEPLGALAGYFLLRQIFGESMFGITFAAVAGIMVYISLDELLPTAEKYGEHHVAIFGLIGGMAVMALSLLLFA